MDGLEEAAELKLRDVYKSYQDRTRVSEVLQMEILRGAREGEDPCTLLLKATRAISLMTGSDTFADQMDRLLRGVYGEALGYQAPLEMEIRDVESRLGRIREAAKTTENDQLQEAMELAIRSHEQRLKRLKDMLEESGKTPEANT